MNGHDAVIVTTMHLLSAVIKETKSDLKQPFYYYSNVATGFPTCINRPFSPLY